MTYTGFCNVELNKPCPDAIGPDGTTEKRYNVGVGTFCNWAVLGRFVVLILILLKAIIQQLRFFNQVLGHLTLKTKSRPDDRGCCVKQMKCSSPYPTSLCMSDDETGKRECRATGGWLEVAKVWVFPTFCFFFFFFLGLSWKTHGLD